MRPKLVGIRHQVHDESDDCWLLRDDVVAGLQTLGRRSLPFDLLVRPRHLSLLPELFRRTPQTQYVIDHLAKPDIRNGISQPWADELANAATFPNVCCKLSGLITEAAAEWRLQDLRPYVHHALECFGPDRLLFGSDWPVCELAGSYSEAFAAALRLTEELSLEERLLIFGGNAQRVYLSRR